MKQYLIDELRLADFKKLKAYLDENLKSAAIEGVYWLELDPSLLSDEQKAHKDCQPFYFSLELLEDRLSCEFLVRTHNRLRCSCIQNATHSQREYLMDVIDAVFEKLEIMA